MDDTGSQDSWNGSEMPIRIAPVEEILIEDDDDDEDVVVVYEGKKKTVSENAPGNNQVIIKIVILVVLFLWSISSAKSLVDFILNTADEYSWSFFNEDNSNFQKY